MNNQTRDQAELLVERMAPIDLLDLVAEIAKICAHRGMFIKIPHDFKSVDPYLKDRYCGNSQCSIRKGERE